jgi:aryl-alcohol dehydrogenase-like predicted oxidoreductase
MEQRYLAGTGMSVSPLCLGTMMFGEWGNPDHEDSARIIHVALEAGINFVDTADVYSRGESEEIVGKALLGRRDEVILATKVHGKMGDDPNQKGNSRRWITMEVENSLRRLQTDWIDLYQIHRPDFHIEIEETLGVLTDLQRQGKIRAFGCSTFPAEKIVEAQWAAERHSLGRFVTEQPPYSIFMRGIERDVLPTAQRYGMGVLPWSPLSGGWLAGKYRRGEEGSPGSKVRGSMMPDRFDTSKPENEGKLDAVEALVELASDSDLSLIHLALGFTLAHPAITAPIIGPRTMEQLESQLGAAEVELSDEVLDRIDEICPPGRNVADETGFTPPAIEQSSLRRR